MNTKLTTLSKVLLAVLVVGLFVGGKYLYDTFAPQKVKESSVVKVDDLPPLEFDKDFARAPLAVDGKGWPSDEVASIPGTEFRAGIMGWNAQSGIMFANGGSVTTKGSFMDEQQVKLRLLVQNDCFKQGEGLLAFIQDYANGNKNSAKGYNMIAWMGDGVPSYLYSLNEQIKKTIGEEYVIQVFAAFGSSFGEDKFMGPIEAKTNPQSLRGSLIVGVLRDGDWNIAMKYCSDNDIPVNNDPTTYDPDALNWMAATDYIQAAEVYVNGKAETRKIVKNGVLTKRDTLVTPNGVVTWFPGDKTAVEKRGGLVTLASTKDYGAQMPNTWLASKKWLADNAPAVEKFILAGLKGGDQVKSHGIALKKASEISQVVYDDASMTAADWEKAFKGYFYTDVKGNRVELGGSRVWNLADNAEYFGLTGGTDKYKAVYETFGNIAVAAYPEIVPAYPAYTEAVNLTYLTKVYSEYKNNAQVAGSASVPTFKENTTISSLVSSKAVSIEFETGSAKISPKSAKTLEELANSFTIAEGLLIEIDGHTDNVGNPELNLNLSKARANAVKEWFMTRDYKLFQNRITTNGYGDTEPVASNATPIGRQKNRRVEIKMGK